MNDDFYTQWSPPDDSLWEIGGGGDVAPSNGGGATVAPETVDVVESGNFQPSGADESGIDDLLKNLIGLNPFDTPPPTGPVTNITNAPVTQVEYSPTTWGFSADDVNSIFSNFADRFTNLLSIPLGGNGVVTPASIPSGYAPNLLQAEQRQGFQSIASVEGLQGGVVGETAGIPWRDIIVGGIVGIVLYYLFKRFV